MRIIVELKAVRDSRRADVVPAELARLLTSVPSRLGCLQINVSSLSSLSHKRNKHEEYGIWITLLVRNVVGLKLHFYKC